MTAMAIEREITDARSIRETGTSGKRKEGHPSCSSGKKMKASSSRGFQGQGHGYQGQGHIKDPSQSGSMTCFHCHQPGCKRRDCPNRQDPMTMGHLSPSHPWDVNGCSMFLFTPAWARGTSISIRVLHQRLLLRRHTREARVRVEVEDKAHRLGL